ncbi:MAG: N-acetylmuramic acid 6-phosphate etherase [Anaerolineae bacterium]|nr:N-acetylmuramic acid 6-phosphate etherase [Anaerolineae bacterium]
MPGSSFPHERRRKGPPYWPGRRSHVNEQEIAQWLTEARNPVSTDLDQRDSLGIVTLMNQEDAKIADAIRPELPKIARAVDIIVERMRKGGRLLYFGAGTSGRLGILDATECVPTFSAPPEQVQGFIAGGPAAVTRSIEGAEDDMEAGMAVAREEARVGPRDVVVGVAASGRTPWVIGALRAAREAGAATIGLVCNPSTPIHDEVDVCIAPVTGPEVLTGSTRLKAGTAQKMVLNMLSTASMIRLGKAYSNLMVDVQPINRKLRARAIRILREAAGIGEEQARALLEASGWEVKTALVMALADVEAHQARRRLAAAGGHVRRAVEMEDVK